MTHIKISLLFIFLLLSNTCSASKMLEKKTINYDNKVENFVLLTEENYFQQMEEVVLPFLQTYMESGYLPVENEKQLYYETFFMPQNKATILIIHGFTEFTKKYDELTYYFLNQGFNVVRYDQRGHGLSSRDFIISENNISNFSKVHIDDFKTYVKDAISIYEQILLPFSENKPIFLFAHSMGGCVASLLIEEQPNFFDGIILNAPMIGINFSGVPKWLINTIVKTAIGFNRGASFAFDHGDYVPNKKLNKDIYPSKSQARYKYATQLRDNNIFYQTNGATFLWVQASLNATDDIFKQKKINNINIPILIFQAEKDFLVSPKAQNKFAKRTPQTKIIFMPDVDHVIFNSQNPFLNAYYYEVFKFLEENL